MSECSRVGASLCSAVLLLSLTLAGASGCGGAPDTPPKPLSTRFDEMYIAQIPLEQKAVVIKSQNDWNVARMENAKAEADLGEAGVSADVASNDLKAAKLSQDSALANKKAAEQSADQTRVNDATRALRAAELAVKAAESRASYLGAYRNWLKRHVRATQENMYYREAQFELAKAELARGSNIAPNGFVYDAYPSQEIERSKRASKAKDKATSLRAKAASAREAWLRAQAEADAAAGKRSQFPDPMATAPTTL